MPPGNDDLFSKWKTIYEELLDPFTGTVADRYFSSFLESLFSNCKKNGMPLSIAILNIPNPGYPHIRNNVYNIRKILSKESMIFYNGEQTFLFILPNINKENTKKLIDHMAKNLPLKGGYAEFPTDAEDPLELQECAKKALNIAEQSNNIIGYFAERRKNTRVPLKLEIRYLAPGFFERLACSRNISETGIMLSGMPDLALGSDIRLTLNLGQQRISVLAKTIWDKINVVTGKMDIGLSFTSTDGTARAVIRRFISNTIPTIVKL